jgi:dienelactone hydrolase
MKRLLLALLAAGTCAHAQESVSFATGARDNPVAAIEGRLYRPNGEGPFPAVVLMHGCNGPTQNVANWAGFFVDRGYVALEVFGFRPRGFQEVCTVPARMRRITVQDRAWDAYGALAYLQSQPHVDGRRVVLMGFSHGGATVLAAATGAFPRPAPPRPDFAAAIPFYPSCDAHALDSPMPMLVVTGALDDWTPSRPCEEKAARARSVGYDVRIVVLAGALHAFDSPIQGARYLANVRNANKPGGCCGATIGGSDTARRQSEREVLEFLERLSPAMRAGS